MSFRPLDGESFSKRIYKSLLNSTRNMSFRPLDGESFSKLNPSIEINRTFKGFRPLDGESFSKLRKNGYDAEVYVFPSPRRGIIF